MPSNHQKLEETRKDPSLEPLEGVWPADTSIPDFWPPELNRINTSGWKPPGSCQLGRAALGKRIQHLINMLPRQGPNPANTEFLLSPYRWVTDDLGSSSHSS